MRKLFSISGLWTLLVAVAIATCLAPSNAHAHTMQVDQLKWAQTSSDSATWATGGGSDTTRTNIATLRCVDFTATVTAANGGPSIAFVVTGFSSNTADSIYFTLEKTWDNGRFYQANRTISSSFVAIRQLNVAGDVVYVAPLNFDADTGGLNNLANPGCSGFRVRVGRISGSSPKLYGVKCYWTYPISDKCW